MRDFIIYTGENYELKNITQLKILDFAIHIVNLFKFLTEEKRKFIMSKQIMRLGTNPILR